MRFKDPKGIEIPDVADDLTSGRVEILVNGASAEAPLTARSLTPDMDWRPPDYHHIAWVLSQLDECSTKDKQTEAIL